MTTETDSQKIIGRLVARVRNTVNANLVVMLVLGVLAGASIGFFGKEAVLVPVAGSVPGWMLGGVGLLATAIVYRRRGNGCGCGGECDGSCSV